MIRYVLSNFSKIAATQGIPGLVQYLKAVSICTQQAIAGYRTPSKIRISRTKAGLPRVFPRFARRLIRLGSTSYMRLALTLSSLYREFVYSSPIKLASIVEPYKGKKGAVNRLKGFIPLFVRLFLQPTYKTPEAVREALSDKFSYIPISKSSPQSSLGFASTNPIVMIRSARAMPEVILDAITTLGSLFKGNKVSYWISRIKAKTSLSPALEPKHSYVGKLGLKQEAAGKMRVFAMVDPWSQLILRPFHLILFKILSKWPMDGTFNQLKPLKRAWGFKSLYSMDLSSATDRLPMSLQVLLFSQIFNLSGLESNAWRAIMVEREYLVPKSTTAVKYAVGQPMGALSSWAMLAVTHHFIVQVAAWEVGFSRKVLFKDYAILGDDIVIFNSRVAKRYHTLITSLGVECNLAKSIMSHKGLGLEFAKKTFYLGFNISPTLLSELYAALQSPVELWEYGRRYKLSLARLLKVAGFGYKVVGGTNRPLWMQNLKVRYLATTMALRDPFVLRDTLPPFLKGGQEGFYELIQPWLKKQYLRVRWQISMDVTKATTLLMRSPSEAYSKEWTLESLTLYNSLYYEIYIYALMKFLNIREESLVALDTAFNGIDWMKMESLELFKLIVRLGEIQQSAARMSFEQLSTTRSEKLNKLHAPRLHRLVTGFNSLLRALKVFLKISPGIVKEYVPKEKSKNRDNIMESSLFGIPMIIIRHILKRLPYRRLGKSAFFSLKKALIRRTIWTVSFSSLLGVLSYFHGVGPVVSGVASIWAVIQGLLLVESLGDDLPEGINPFFQVVGNVILHSFELYLAGVILVTVTHFGTMYTLCELSLEAYRLGDLSLYSLLWDIISFPHRLFIDVAAGLIPSPEQVTNVLRQTDHHWGWSFGIGALLFWLIKWFFGI